MTTAPAPAASVRAEVDDLSIAARAAAQHEVGAYGRLYEATAAGRDRVVPHGPARTDR